MIKIKEAVIVEGKYDKMRLKGVIEATIIETNGFRIFKDKEKVSLIKKLAEKQGIVILTDSDSAGFVIRNYLKGMIAENKIKNAYIPQIVGKEKRKDKPSKEGFLGVEGIDEKLLTEVLGRAGVTLCDSISDTVSAKNITVTDLFNLKLSGCSDSKKRRNDLLNYLELPPYISTKALLEILNSLFTLEQLKTLLDTLNC
ncbi:MAG: DUF4093 domain-containing protein [Clostridia bacterium]|nr:DUF4093 domain-containing protein [Clostridia bacterium]